MGGTTRWGCQKPPYWSHCYLKSIQTLGLRCHAAICLVQKKLHSYSSKNPKFINEIIQWELHRKKNDINVQKSLFIKIDIKI